MWQESDTRGFDIWFFGLPRIMILLSLRRTDECGFYFPGSAKLGMSSYSPVLRFIKWASSRACVNGLSLFSFLLLLGL